MGLFLGLLSSCAGPAYFYDQAYGSTEQNFTLGMVQREICPGMSQEDVAAAIGSPNIVTKDQGNKETWIYDKIATEVRRSESSGLCLFFRRGCDNVARLDKTQKTLTIVIKFNENKCVEDIDYHASKF